MDRFTANDTKASFMPTVFSTFPLKFGKKMPKAEPKRAFFASSDVWDGDFLGFIPPSINDDVLWARDNFSDSDAFGETQGLIGTLGWNDEYHADAHIEDLIHLVHGDIT